MAMRFAPNPLGAGAPSTLRIGRVLAELVIHRMTYVRKVWRHRVNHLLFISVVAQLALH